MRQHTHGRHGRGHDDESRERHRDGNLGDRRFAHDPLASGTFLGGERHPGERHPGERHPGERPERHGGHRHGGRRRLFDYGDLRFILLGMIADRPAHGYDLIKALEERMGGGYSPSPGVIYPTLTMLEEQGFADVTPETGKKLYRATEDGRAYLVANQATVDAIEARIDAVAKERNTLPPAPLLRAVENLKTALRLRLAAGPIPADRVAAIAAAIDAAAAEAERG